MRIIIVILEFGFTRPWGQGPWGGFELSLEFWRFGVLKVCNCQQSIWLRLCRPRGKAGVGLWGFLRGAKKGPNRVQKEGLKSHILGLFEFWKHPARSKTTRQEICATIEEHGSKEGPKSGPEITDSRAV